ncbi:MAG: PKD domain-containing protein, partial [Saprospiraceae bacterium]|nr:PKD domain-containing protein [Saprospiraceae bacterium]
NTAAGREVKHRYDAAGPYNVRLTVTAQSGCTSTQVQALKVPEPPQLNFVAPPSLCANSATPLSLAGSNELTQVNWTFGDPLSGALDTASGAGVYHRYDLPGTYTVTATATNIAGCTASQSQQVDIEPNLLSGVISPAGPATMCAGQSIALSAPPVGATYKWSSSSTQPSIQVSATGVYSVTITDASGCTYAPPPKAVEVLPAPAGVIKAVVFDDAGLAVGIEPQALRLCAGETAQLFTTATAGYNYQWSSGGTTSVQIFSEDRFNSLSVGTHIFTVTITNTTSGCTAVTAPFPVTVNPVPAGFSAVTDQICAGIPANVRYQGPQPPGWQFFWNNGETGPGFTTTEPGHYFVRVVNEFGCTAVSEKVTIKPGPNIAALPSGCHRRCAPDTLCVPNMPDIASWQWFLNGAPIPGATGPKLVATQSGLYHAELTDTSGCFAQSAKLTLELYTGIGSIHAVVWSDVNDNGLIDPADTLLSGIPVQLWQNGAPTASGLSGAAGAFTFNQVPSVDGFVAVDSSALPAGWQIAIGQEPANLVGCGASTQAELLLHLSACLPTAGTLNVSACAGTDYDFN